MGFRERAQQLLSGGGGGGGFADRARSRLSGEPEVRATLEGLDAEAEAQRRRLPEATMEAPVADESWQADYEKTRGGPLNALKDAANAFGEGAYKAIGLDPTDLFGDKVGARIQVAHQASPMLAGASKFVGEAGVQAGLGLGPVAGGFLSGIGNTKGSLQDKAAGGVVGGVLGKAADVVARPLTGLLTKGINRARSKAVDEGLKHSGATEADLLDFDKQGGRDLFAEGAERLGLTGRPSNVAPRAKEVAAAQQAERRALEQQANVDTLAVDPANIRAGIEDHSSYIAPGVNPMQRAAQNAAEYVDNLNTPQGVPWRQADKQRQYWGNKTNFASGTPENSLKKGVHRVLNDELSGSMSQRAPGTGEAWRKAGLDEHTAIELGEMAARGAGRAPALTKGDVGLSLLGGAAGSLMGGAFGGTAGAMAGLGARSAFAANKHAIAQKGAQASGLLQKFVRGGLNSSLPGVAAGNAGAGLAKPRTPAEQTQTALDLLYSPSQGAELGRFKALFAQAAANPDSEATQKLITRLRHTEPEFVRTILPILGGSR